MAEIRTKRPGFFLRLLLRVVHPSKRKVWTASDLAEVRGLLRFVRVFLLTVFLPGVVLALIGLQSVRSQSLSMEAEVRRSAQGITEAVRTQTQDSFSGFEVRVRQRLASGQSPLEDLAELSPHLRVALQLGPSGELIAPLQLPGGLRSPFSDLLFSQEWLEATRAEAEKDFSAALLGYRKAEARARGERSKGEALFARGRVLSRMGRKAEAVTILNRVIQDYSGLRESHGFRLHDLARLALAEQTQETNPGRARKELETLAEDLLNTTWMIGTGGEPAVCNRVLEALESSSEPNWLSSSRSRLEAKTTQLYWAEQVLPRLQTLSNNTGPIFSSDNFFYEVEDAVLWSTLAWGENVYAFIFEVEAVQGDLQNTAVRLAEQAEEVDVLILRNDATRLESEFARRSLAPKLPGFSAVAKLGTLDLLTDRQRRRRRQQMVLIGLPVLLFVAGGVLTSRMIGQEIKIASMKADFAANVSHELRSPITQIRLKGEFLQMGFAEGEKELQDHYDVIVRESERLSRLVDNVLDFAAIESGTKSYALRPADIGETIRSAVESSRYAMETRGLMMDLEVPVGLPVVLHEPEAIQQVLQNLISNAAKYGEKGGWIGIRARVVHQRLDVSVSDRGIGMTDEELGHIFEKFYRSKSPLAQRKKGTGIGLAIVQYIVEAHHASISVKSTPGLGTTFTLHFPIRSPVSSGL
jgi:signal transduction histidine kinase